MGFLPEEFLDSSDTFLGIASMFETALYLIGAITLFSSYWLFSSTGNEFAFKEVTLTLKLFYFLFFFFSSRDVFF